MESRKEACWAFKINSRTKKLMGKGYFAGLKVRSCRKSESQQGAK